LLQVPETAKAQTGIIGIQESSQQDHPYNWRMLCLRHTHEQAGQRKKMVKKPSFSS